jgi:type II secretory pathway pseudopilin PulG
MAVIAILGMIFAFGAPRLGSNNWRALRDEAESIAASIEFARQRAIMTGTPHRLLIDLGEGGYRVEWLATEDEAFAAITGQALGSDAGLPLAGGLLGDPGMGAAGTAPDGRAEPVSLRPPPRAERDFHPIPNRQLGSFTWLEDALYFVGLESPSGWTEGGEVAIVFEADGSTDFSLLELADVDDNHLTLEIEPLLDRVRRRQGTARGR